MRNIGIIGDGKTDRTIFKKIVQSILPRNENDNVNFVELNRPSLGLRNAIDKYWKDSSKQGKYYLPTEHAKELEQETTQVLIGGFKDFEAEIVGYLSNKDILILTADAEKIFKREESYFDEWGFSISKILFGASEKFYSVNIRYGYNLENLPLILSIVTFPSTEVLVAAAKNNNNAHYGKKPNQLKQELYQTDNLSTITPEQLETKALKFINSTTIKNIYGHVPEIRLFIQTLSCLSKQ